jgi:hypothetical protein
VNPWLSPVLFWLVLLGGWWSFRVIARGVTQKRAERAIHNYVASLRRITEGSCR